MARAHVTVLVELAAHASLWGIQIKNPRELYEWAKSNITGYNFSFHLYVLTMLTCGPEDTNRLS